MGSALQVMQMVAVPAVQIRSRVLPAERLVARGLAEVPARCDASYYLFQLSELNIFLGPCRWRDGFSERTGGIMGSKCSPELLISDSFKVNKGLPVLPVAYCKPHFRFRRGRAAAQSNV